ncbi:ComEA family DNA-binding protein [Algoriphagus sediminis]|uniref:Helix-hairpin-helix domain-containing protein n=1 Tax=Algoriphagus sediminis TaxID=3057113 RepID=A0ABT7Y867_9BACT|nr:helix-hairpin-helix domain-containing protein [Algoriphagus sediminis]MDN3202718.1 helix-hairpin-helix domain-containing protein [Algoriphagus sediminis]
MSRIFFWLRSNFGFSKKESRGYLLVVPILFLIYWVPRSPLFQRSDQMDNYSQEEFDSLLANGWMVAESDLTFNPADTSKSPSSNIDSGIKVISISEADSVVLQIVPGIGPTLAGRIVKYRENLGGFHSKEQLSEVYGLSDEVSERIWEYFSLDEISLERLRINSISRDELAKHPYVSYGAAKVILAYRNQHGPFQSSEDLQKIKIFDESWISKISPYLDFEY